MMTLYAVFSLICETRLACTIDGGQGRNLNGGMRRLEYCVDGGRKYLGCLLWVVVVSLRTSYCCMILRQGPILGASYCCR